MNSKELLQLRSARWRMQAGAEPSAFTQAVAISFVSEIGFCAVYPVPGVMLPTLAGVALGNMDALAAHIHLIKKNPDDIARTHLLETVARMLREKDAFEVPFAGTFLLASANEFPYFYALV